MCGVDFLLHHHMMSSVNSTFHTSVFAGTGSRWGNGRGWGKRKEIFLSLHGGGEGVCVPGMCNSPDDPYAHPGWPPGDAGLESSMPGFLEPSTAGASRTPPSLPLSGHAHLLSAKPLMDPSGCDAPLSRQPSPFLHRCPEL